MKIKFVILLLLINILSDLHAQESGWHWVNPYPLPFITSMFTDVNEEIYVFSDNNQIYKISNAEIEKIETPLPDSSLINFDYYRFDQDFTIVNDSVWYVYHGWLGSYFTEDGGKTYVEIESGPQVREVYDKENVMGAKYIFPSPYETKVSKNNGLTWEVVLNKKGEMLMHTSDSLYVIAKDTLFFSADGGYSWEQGAVVCYDCNRLHIIGKELLLSSDKYFYKSLDNGKSFEIVSELEFSDDGGAFTHFYSSFKDKLLCAVSPQRVFSSTDSAEDWNYHIYKVPGDVSFANCYYKNDSIILIRDYLGTGTILEMNINTEKFIDNYSNGMNNLSHFHVLEDSVYMLSSFSSYGYFRYMYLSYDKGYTWEKHNLPVNHLYNPIVFGIDCPNEEVVYYATDSFLYSSKIPFDEWTRKDIPDGKAKLGVKFYDEEKGLYVDSDGRIGITNDAGDSWEIKDSFPMNYYLVELMIDSKKPDEAWIFCSILNEDKTILFQIVNGSIVDSFLFDYIVFKFQGSIYKNGKIYLSFEKKNFRLDVETKVLKELCGFTHWRIIDAYENDTLMIQFRGQFFKVDEECNKYEIKEIDFGGTLNADGNFNSKFDFYFDEDGEGFGFNKDGYMLKLTNNFREDLLIATKEEPIADIKKESLYLYPNPAYDRVFISKAVSDPRIVLYDMNGRVMKQSESQEMEIGDMGMGMYFYVIMDGGEYVGSGKLVVVR